MGRTGGWTGEEDKGDGDPRVPAPFVKAETAEERVKGLPPPSLIERDESELRLYEDGFSRACKELMDDAPP